METKGSKRRVFRAAPNATSYQDVSSEPTKGPTRLPHFEVYSGDKNFASETEREQGGEELRNPIDLLTASRSSAVSHLFDTLALSLCVVR